MSTIEVADSTTRANDQGLFQCGSCKRNYNRLDHLARHVRSHTNFKPHRCPICCKSFARSDLLKRHVSAHDVRDAKVNNLSRGAADEVPGRVSQASAEGLQQPSFDDDFMDSQLELPTGCCTPTFAEWNFLPGLWSTAGSNDVGLVPSFPTIDVDHLDLRFLDSYNTTIPFELGHHRSEIWRQAPQRDNSVPLHAVSEASEAFRKHHWRFRPNTRDHRAAEEHNLRVTPARLSSAARDNILTIVVKCCRPENLPKAVASFPSVELLDTLIQFYLTSLHARADSFIHAATFHPNDKKPELLLAMAAAGAVLTADPTLTKLGFAMQECIRTAVAALWESDNTLVRNLELTQAFLINLEIGLWSGQSRKVEITESFLQSPLTMFRRGGRFRRSNYAPVHIDNPDDPSGETDWQAWIQQESFKRTAFRIVQHDFNSSTYLLINPLISYAELTLPLPCATTLWAAPTAQEWKAALLSQGTAPSQHPPTVADYLDDPGAFTNPESMNILDITLANEAFLACVWVLAWECIQLSSLQRSNPRRWNTFLLASRREELLKLLEHFRLSLQLSDSLHHWEVRMRLELVQLHLHCPFEDVQLFAGIEGPEQARSIYPAVLEWVKTDAARKAICHAGQILRFAKSMGRGLLQGPLAIVMYQASLVLWVYALLCAKSTTSPGASSSREDGRDAVWLDGEDELVLRRFTHIGVGRPFFKGSAAAGTNKPGTEVSMFNSEAVLGVVITIIRDNYEGLPKPHLVERVLGLLEALQKSSAAMMEFHRQLDKQ
ncbi:hypothetical protein VTI74DRAFT_8482 [Chaetomium olivicolor]